MVSGYYAKVLKNSLPKAILCPNCQLTNKLVIVVTCRVHHLIFIPLYADRKRVEICCNFCKTCFAPSTFPQLSTDSKEMLKQATYRWYHYLGGLIFIGGILFLLGSIFLNNSAKDKQNLSNLNYLAPGSVISYKLENGELTTMKINKIVGDTLFVFENNFSTNKGKSAVDRDENYDDKQTYFLLNELTKWHQAGRLVEVENE